MASHLLTRCALKLGFPGGADSKESACLVGDQVQSLGGKDPLEKGTATHLLGESLGQTSLVFQRVRHD